MMDLAPPATRAAEFALAFNNHIPLLEVLIGISFVVFAYKMLKVL